MRQINEEWIKMMMTSTTSSWGLQKTQVWFCCATTDKKLIGSSKHWLWKRSFGMRNWWALLTCGVFFACNRRPRWCKLGQPVCRVIFCWNFKLQLSKLCLGFLQLLEELRAWLGHGAWAKVLVCNDLRCGGPLVQILSHHELKAKKNSRLEI